MKHSPWSKISAIAGLVFVLTACPGPSNPPAGDFSLRLEPGDPKLAPGGKTTASLKITRNNGFTGAIQLSLENAPSGVTASFDPNPATGEASTVTLEVPKTLAAGNYTVQVKGVSGAASSSTSVTVAVAPVPPPTVTVDATVTPIVPSVPALPDGVPRPVVALTDTKGHQVNYIQNELVIFSDDQAAVNAFVARWNGKILDRADPPNKKGVPGLKSVYTVRIDASSADGNQVVSDLSAITPNARSDLRLSNDLALKLLAVAAREKASGIEVALNYLWEDQTFDDLSSNEGPTSQGVIGSGSYSPNVFDWPYMKRGGNQDIGVVDAWRALERAGKINVSGASTNAIKLGIIDGGFSDSNGANTDFPNHTVEADEWNQPNPSPCSGGNSCPWHGTNVALTAAARLDNNFGTAGPAGPVARLMLEEKAFISLGGTSMFELIDQDARIINMSYGARFPAVVAWIGAAFNFFTSIAVSNDILLFASAGNDGETVDGEDCFGFCWEEAFYSPCENAGVICVGGLADDSTDRHPNSNYGGEDVRIYGPFRVYVGADPDSAPGANRVKSGTSFSSPFVAGVAALVWAAKPSLSRFEVAQILMETSRQIVTPPPNLSFRRVVNAFAAVSRALGNTPPRVTITAPSAVSSIANDDPFGKTFTATASDLEKLENCCTFTWVSDKDGTLGTGSSITAKFPGKKGSRTITVTATDDKGAPHTDSVSVNVLNPPPVVTISAPTANQKLYRGIGYLFNASALDDSLSVPCGQFTWSSSRAGDPAGNTCDPLMTFATNGTRTLKVKATDALGDAGEASVSVEVVNPPLSGPPIVRIVAPNLNQQFYPTEKSFIGYSATDPDGGTSFTARWTVKFGGQEKPVTIAIISGFNTFVPSDYVYGNSKCPGGTETAELWVYVTDAQGQVGTAHIPYRVLYPPC